MKTLRALQNTRNCRDLGVTTEKLVLLKVGGLAAAERDFFF